MSSRLSFVFAVLLLLLGAVLRFNALTTLPSGLHEDEITNIRITETARSGNIEVLYDLGDEGREGFYHILLTFLTSGVGKGTLGFRIVSAWASLLTLAAVYAVGRRLSGTWGGLAAAGLMTGSLWPLLLGRSITPNTLLPLLLALTLLALSIALPIYRRKRTRGDNTTVAAILGLLLGIGIYVHPVWLLVVVASLLFIVYMLRTRQKISRRRLSYISFMLLIMIIMSVPYLVSTIRHPELSGLARLSDGTIHIHLQSIIDGIGGLFISGDTNPTHNLPGRPLFDTLTASLMLFGVVVAARGWRKPRYALLLIPLILLSPVFLFSSSAPNFNNYAALLPLFALLFGVGISTLHTASSGAGKRLTEVLVIWLIVFNAAWAYDDLFNNWPDTPEVQAAYNTRLGQLAAHIDRSADDIPTVICGWRATQTPDAPSLTDAQLMGLMMNRVRDADIRYVDCRQALIMTNSGNEQQVILPDSRVIDNAHPELRRWLEQGTFHQTAALPPQSVLIMDVEESLASRVGQFVNQIEVTYPSKAGGTPDEKMTMPVSFGGNLTMLGYTLPDKETYAPGDTLVITSYWRTQGMVPPDLLLFTHVLSDPGASPPANRDIINLNPRYLRDRDVFVQITQVPLPESLPEGEYQLSVGGYQDTSDERLNVLQDGEPRGTRLFLETITVTAGES